MKKGINLWCFPSEWSFDKKLAVARDAGFHGVELNVDCNGYLTDQTSKGQLEEIKSLVEQHDLEITSISSSLFWEFSITSNDIEVRQKAKDILKKMIDIASFLSVPTILVVPGLVTEEVGYDVAYERSKNAFFWIWQIMQKRKRLSLQLKTFGINFY